MRKSLLLFFFLTYAVYSHSQSILTIRETYNFNVNDEFHRKYLNIPPNVERTKITSKYFSLANDTVFYGIYNEGYYSTVNNSTGTPYLEYQTTSSTDTIFFTNLDSSITMEFPSYTLDSCNTYNETVYYSPQYCGELAYEYEHCINTCFEPHCTNKIYGRGLGVIFYHEWYPAQSFDVTRELIYYKKDTITCGTPDTFNPVTIVESVQNKNNIITYPNPAFDLLNISNVQSSTKIELYDITGRMVFERTVNKDVKIDTSELRSGIYNAVIRTANKTLNEKVVITH
jgi:hypothetical protein